MNSDLDLASLRQWIGRTQDASDVVTSQLVRSLRATLFLEPGRGEIGDPAPLAVHWCLANPVGEMKELAEDGHFLGQDFLPPVPLPRRMRAGGKLEYFDRLRVGDEVRKTSRIANVTSKIGASGILCFVTIEHTISTPRGTAIAELQELVYRGPPTAQHGPSHPKVSSPATKPQFQRSLSATAVFLFRYSALTFNGHRIHYDLPYAVELEGYPGLVVHGPLQASLLLEEAAAMNNGIPPKIFTYRNTNPLFAGGDFTINAQRDECTCDLWITSSSGVTTVSASAAW
jgi:3-methylfumaryl-CoA hydratase